MFDSELRALWGWSGESLTCMGATKHDHGKGPQTCIDGKYFSQNVVAGESRRQIEQ